MQVDRLNEASNPALFGRRAADRVGGRVRVREYLSALMASFAAPSVAPGVVPEISELPEHVFAALVKREFCYLSKTRVERYRDNVLRQVEKATTMGLPIHFYYDIGGGYHASLHPGKEDVSFTVGIGELFLLRQIKKFANRIVGLYPPGVRFHLVVDNLCAHLINDIEIERTLSYCQALRELIGQTGMESSVDLLVESDRCSLEDFEKRLEAHRTDVGETEVTLQEHRNVERFLGRLCDGREALARCIRYREVVAVSESLLEPLIKGVHMTQRATPETICFRPFPGGDSRIQSGEVALRASGSQLGPVLLTSANVQEYLRYQDRPIDMLPAVIPHVTYAVPLS